MRRLQGAVVVLWLYTICAGFFLLYAPLLPVLLVDPVLFRLLTDLLFSLWQLYPVGLFQWMFKCRVLCYGDRVRSDESSIIIINHRTRLDWNYAWIALYHVEKSSSCIDESVDIEDKPSDDPDKHFKNFITEETTNCIDPIEVSTHIGDNLLPEDPSDKALIVSNALYNKLVAAITRTARLKYVLKDQIKFFPAVGWIMQMNHFLFLKRRWDDDESCIQRFAQYFKKLHDAVGYRYQVLVFPEGTDLTEDTRERSNRYARRHKLQEYQHVLQPRTRGFAALCSRLRAGGLAAVYDATLAYDAPPKSEMDVLRGHLPRSVYFHVTRHAAAELPADEEGLAAWLSERWRQKECRLEHFHQHGELGNGSAKLRSRSLTRARWGFLFWCCIDVLFLLAVSLSAYTRCWVVYNALLLTAVSYIFGGVHNLQLPQRFTQKAHGDSAT